jgi:glutathione S-transferase
MLKLYFAPRTRSVRIRWLLEELGIPHELERVEFRPRPSPFAQATPFGKFPVLVDGDVVMAESGAILEYVLEVHGNGRLAPAVGSPQRGEFLQWVHFAEGTAFPPLGVLIWHGVYRADADRIPEAMDSARDRAHAALAVVEKHLATREHLLGSEFSAADIMVGFTLAAARFVGVLDSRYPLTTAYLGRLMERPAFQRATAN